MDRLKPRRSIFEIFFDILDFCRVPHRLTHIMQFCNLNTPAANKYIELLLSRNMLHLDSEFYRTTEAGLRYIELMEEMYMSLFR